MSEIRWFIRKPLSLSGASGASRHARRRLPIVPGPYRVRLHVGRELRLHGDAAVVRGDGDPVLIGDAMPGAGARVQVQVVARGDLPQPRVLRTPRVVHEHRTLRDGVEWERSEEHTSELQSLMRSSYAVFCLKKKKKPN